MQGRARDRLRPRGRRLGLAVAAVLYLAVGLYLLRPVLPAPASTVPHPVRAYALGTTWERLFQSDQKLTVALITYDVRALFTRPWRFTEGPQCHPLGHAMTLGHFMLGEGLRGALPFALTRDPILTYNLVVLSTFWCAALAMYALVAYWTRSGAAALVAGLAFALDPASIASPGNLHVVGNLWTPLVLLFMHRLCVHRRWRDATGLTLFAGLQLLEGVYPTLAALVFGAVYGSYLLVRTRGTRGTLAPKITAAGAALGALAVAVVGPYFAEGAPRIVHAQAWATTNDLGAFAPGGFAFPGVVLTALALVGLLDRVRVARRSEGYDPRLVFLAAGLTTLWASVGEIPLPLTDAAAPGLLTLLRALVPGLELLRTWAAVGSGMRVAAAFLAGFGVLALVENRGALVRGAVVLGSLLALVGETVHPSLAESSFGTSLALRAVRIRPPESLLMLYERMPPGAVIDLPLDYGFGGFLDMSDDVLLGAFHGHRVASCYNSFRTPVQDDVAALARRLASDRDAAAALYALGFRSVVLHLANLKRQPALIGLLASPPDYLVPLGRTAGYAVYRLDASVTRQAG